MLRRLSQCLGLALFLCLTARCAFAEPLRIINSTDRPVTVYGIYEREWAHGGASGNWGGWAQLCQLGPHSSQVVTCQHGRWRIGAQTPHGHVLGPWVIRVERDVESHFRIRD